jgi:NitT/TauT family transport system permease protein
MKHGKILYLVNRIFPPLLVFVFLTAGLQWALGLFHVPQYEFPRPSLVAQSLFQNREDLLSATWTTTEATLIGFGSSTIFGVSAAILLCSSTWLRRALYPYTLFFQTVPIVAIAPMLIKWFNPGLTSVSISAFIVSVFPVIANTLAGLLSTDPALVDLFRLYNASPLDRLIKLRLPYALPNIVTGLRVAAGLAVIGAIVGEFLVGELGDSEGLGVKIVSAAHNLHMGVMFAAVLLASLLGLALFASVNWLGYLVLRRWQPSE